MLRAVLMTGTWYTTEIEDIVDDRENIEAFASEGTPVLIVSGVEDLTDLLGDDIDIVSADD